MVIDYVRERSCRFRPGTGRMNIPNSPKLLNGITRKNKESSRNAFHNPKYNYLCFALLWTIKFDVNILKNVRFILNFGRFLKML